MGGGVGGSFVGKNLPALPSYCNQKWFHFKEKTETRNITYVQTNMQIKINMDMMNSFIKVHLSSILLKIFKVQNN